jgi:hypothetical protein
MGSVWRLLSGAAAACGHWLFRDLPFRGIRPWDYRCPRCGIKVRYGRKEMGRPAQCRRCRQAFTLPFVCED